MSVAAAELPELSRSSTRSRGAPPAPRPWAGTDHVLHDVHHGGLPGRGQAIIAAIYERGRFEADDTMLVWLILAAYATALLSVGSSRLLQNVLYAVDDVKATAWIAVIRVAHLVGPRVRPDVPVRAPRRDRRVRHRVRATCPPLWSRSRRQPATAAPLRLGAVGLAVAASIGAWVEVALLQRKARQHLGRPVHVAHQQSRFLLAGSRRGRADGRRSWRLTADVPSVIRRGRWSSASAGWRTSGWPSCSGPRRSTTFSSPSCVG